MLCDQQDLVIFGTSPERDVIGSLVLVHVVAD